MRGHLQKIRQLSILSIWLIIAVAFLLFTGISVGVALILQPGSWHYTCSDFGSYQEAKSKYDSGAHYLARNVKEIPCLALYKEEHHD